jgi:CRISPR-associated protein Cas1
VTHVDVPDLVPARMVNEFTYCPRLFHLEWVQVQWAESADTAEGSHEHRAVDRPGGLAPLPDEGDIRAARSLQLSSTALGLVAKVDLLEGDGELVRPVDTKRGHPPDNAERSWEPERVQLCVQALLLREAGYRVEEGVLYFAGARQRITVPITEALVARTRELVGELQEVAASELAPEPLVDSKKCPRCSLAGICLPDETNTLAARSDRPARRLLPSEPSARPMYVVEQGVTIGVRSGRVEVTRRGEETGRLESVRLIDVSQISVYGGGQVSTQLLKACFKREIPVLWFSYGGWFEGMAVGLPSKHVELRRRQIALAHNGSTSIASEIVRGKIMNARTLLRRNARTPVDGVVSALKVLASKTADVASTASLLGIEGAAARLYFGAFPAMVREGKALPGGPFSFDGRNRRPPADPINCLLSFVYGLLVKDLTTTVHAVGFDPYVGFYHRPRFGRPALSLDLAEEFRPLVADSVVLNVVNNGEVRPSHFLVRAGGVALTTEGRRAVIAAYERRMETEIKHPTFGYRITYRRVLEVQARVLAAHLLGEVPAYVSFVTR